MRAIALVVAVVLAIVGVGVGVVSGNGLPHVPPGWVAIDDGQAQIAVPSNWHIAYNDLCAGSDLAGTVDVFTHNVLDAACLSMGNPTASAVSIVPLRRTASARWHRHVINGIPVWEISVSQVGLPSTSILVVPSLGVEIGIRGPNTIRVLDTLTHS